MSKLQTTLTTEVTLGAKTQAHLEALMQNYAVLEDEAALISEQMDEEKKTITAIMEDAGVTTLRVDNRPVCLVKGATSSKLSKPKLLAQGITMAQIEAATTRSPKKTHLRMGKVGDKEVVPDAD